MDPLNDEENKDLVLNSYFELVLLWCIQKKSKYLSIVVPVEYAGAQEGGLVYKLMKKTLIVEKSTTEGVYI